MSQLDKRKVRTMTIRVDRWLRARIRCCAALRHQTVSEFVSEVMTPNVQHLEEFQREIIEREELEELYEKRRPR